MTDPMREALEAAQQFIRNGVEGGYIRLPDHPDPALDTLPKIEAALSALTASAPKGEQQPVAWRVRLIVGVSSPLGWEYYSNKPAQHPRYEVEPLYTSPPPAAGWDEAIEAALGAITELDCMYVNDERVPYGGIPADPESSVVRVAIQNCEEAVSALRREAPASSGVVASDLDAEIAALAHNFWSIHPGSLDEMGLTREQFYAQEMSKLIKAVRG